MSERKAIPYFPFDGQPYQPKMGLKPLDRKNWLEFDGQHLPHLALKKKLFQTERDTVLQIKAGSEAACLELHSTIRAHVLNQHPDLFREGGGGLLALATGERFGEPKDAEEALEQISRWGQEDWCLVDPGAPFSVIAGFVCFPSRWSLREKMGRTPDGVHEGVPSYNNFLAAPVRNFFEKLIPERPMWRLNWTIHDSDQLFCPGPHSSGKKLTADNVLENCFLRVERQTLSRLPQTGAIAFSIRTHLHPLLVAIDTPERKKLALASILGLPLETALYRGMGPFLEPLKEALGRNG
jgi:hypothetical protein